MEVVVTRCAGIDVHERTVVVGRVQPHHRFLLAELLAQIDGLDETIARFDAEIARRCVADEQEAVVQLLDTIPGVGRAMAELLVAEVGVDMDKFPTPAHLAAWAGVAPVNNESGGRQGAGKTRKGNAWLKTALAARYRRIAGRRGAKRAIMAVAHRLLIIVHRVSRLQLVVGRFTGTSYLSSSPPA